MEAVAPAPKAMEDRVARAGSLTWEKGYDEKAAGQILKAETEDCTLEFSGH
jgi:hypothetical protein